MTNNAFVSIVAHRGDPELLLVRGRFAGDVAAFLGRPASAETVSGGADYRFRMTASRAEVSCALAVSAAAVNYPNFKNSCAPWRHAVYLRLWRVLHEAQCAARDAGGRWRMRLARGGGTAARGV